MRGERGEEPGFSQEPGCSQVNPNMKSLSRLRIEKFPARMKITYLVVAIIVAVLGGFIIYFINDSLVPAPPVDQTMTSADDVILKAKEPVEQPLLKHDKEPGDDKTGKEILMPAEEDEKPAEKKKKAKERRAPEKASGESKLPEKPTEDDVKKAMAAVEPAVKTCAMGTSGKAVVNIVFSGQTGKATSVKVIGGAFHGTQYAPCIEKVVKIKATVPKFKKKSFSQTYTYALY